MTTFDLAEVREFAAEIGTRIDRYLDGEGTERAALDDALENYARLCRDFIAGVGQWKDAVFHGRAAFDPEVEAIWKEEGRAAALGGAGPIPAWPAIAGVVRPPGEPGCAGGGPEGTGAAARGLGDSRARRRTVGPPAVHAGPGRDRGRGPAGRIAAVPAGGLATGRPRTAGELPEAPKVLIEARSWPDPPSFTESGMSDGTSILLTPIAIDLDSPEFEEIRGWRFDEDYVGRRLEDDVRLRVDAGPAGSGPTAIRRAGSPDLAPWMCARTMLISQWDAPIPTSPCWPSTRR